LKTPPYAREAQDTPYGVVMVQLRNPAGDVLGVIAVAKDFSASRSTMGKSMIWLAMYSLFAFVILAGIITMVVRGAITRPLGALNAKFDALASGEAAEPLDNPDQYYSELGTLAQHYETLRTQREAATPAGQA
jgi:methyl-accepting chemotaxis protein